MGLIKYHVTTMLMKFRLVGIVRCASAEEAYEKSLAIVRGGVKILEISLNTPDAISVINRLKKELGDKACIGAGTVLDSESARAVILGGAEFVISPNLDKGLVTTCNRYAVPCIPGVGSSTEIVKALEYGVDIVKGFPGSLLGIPFIKAVKGPIPQVEIIPVGGVNPGNIEEWFKGGAFAVALGSALTHPNTGDDPANVEKAAREAVELVEKCKP